MQRVWSLHSLQYLAVRLRRAWSTNISNSKIIKITCPPRIVLFLTGCVVLSSVKDDMIVMSFQSYTPNTFNHSCSSCNNSATVLCCLYNTSAGAQYYGLSIFCDINNYTISWCKCGYLNALQFLNQDYCHKNIVYFLLKLELELLVLVLKQPRQVLLLNLIVIVYEYYSTNYQSNNSVVLCCVG